MATLTSDEKGKSFSEFEPLKPYISLRSLGTYEKVNINVETDSDSSSDDSDDERVTPLQMENSARLLASIMMTTLSSTTEKKNEKNNTNNTNINNNNNHPSQNKLLSAYCCHNCFSQEKIDDIMKLTEIHVAKHGWLTKRHAQHPTTDFSLLDAPLVWAAAEPIITNKVLPTLISLYFNNDDGDDDNNNNNSYSNNKQVTLKINDLFYVRYDGDTENAQRELEAHRDGSLLSFSIALTSPDSFIGGGTRFVGSSQVLRPEKAGDLVLHSGKVLHAGEMVTKGVRDILVGFVTASGTCINETFLASHMVTRCPVDDNGLLDSPIVNGALIRTAL